MKLNQSFKKSTLVKLIIKILNFSKKLFIYIYNSFLDSWYYFKYSTLNIFNKNNQENLSAMIIAHVHSIERAFSLKNTKTVFGIELVTNLKKLISQINNNEYNYELQIAHSAIAEYEKYHRISCTKNSTLLPYKYYKHNKFNNSSSYLSVVKSRHSIRNFGNKPINYTDVIKAIALAKDTTPSVCNRQGWEVILVRNKVLINQILNLQTGNRGIENIQCILIVCATLRSFFGSSERNQPYVDAGIFLMSLLNSLHYKNIACCTLNWSVDRTHDKKLKKLLGIDNSREIIAFIALGSYPEEEIKIASSHRKPLKRILKIVD